MLAVTPEQIQELYVRFGYAVFRRCLRITRSRTVAEDLLHDVFVRVLRYGSGYQGGSALAWLQRIADRVCLDRLRRDGRSSAPGYPDADPGGARGADLPVPEASRLLGELLAALPERLREVAILYFVDDMNQEEIADALGCSTMTVKRRLRSLREHANGLNGGELVLEVPHVELEP